jgi:hypothetical protein
MTARTRTLPAFVALLATVLAIAAFGFAAFGVAQDHAADRYHVEIEMPNHLAMGMNEQDVFIAGDVPGTVVRITADDVDPNAMLYASATFAPHNPVDPSDVGPFPRGAELGITQGEWLEGIGRATVTCDGDSGHVSARFERLVPHGVYTLWYFFMAYPPTTPFATYDMPVGDRAGTQNVFVADADGNASLDVHVSPCLQLSGRQTLAGLAAAYHSDGQTYGGVAGEFGTVAHLHVFNFLPSEAQALATASAD